MSQRTKSSTLCLHLSTRSETTLKQVTIDLSCRSCATIGGYLLTSYERPQLIVQYAGEAETVELSSDDIVVPTVGWIVTFPEEESVAQDTATAGSSDGLAMGLKGDSGLWVWWVWLIYALLVACCLVPLCCLLCRR